MNRTRKLIIMLITLVPVLVILVVGVLHIINEYRRLVENAEQIFEYELSRRFRREVDIGEARVTPFGTAILRDVKIAAVDRIENGTILEAREIRVRYGIRDLLMGRFSAQNVESVIVVEPRIVLVRQRSGRFNIQDLLGPPPARPGLPFQGVVRIIDARVVFQDYYVSPTPNPLTTVFENLQAIVDAGGHPVYSFSGTAESGPRRFDTARFAGTYDSRTRSVQVDVNARNVQAPFIVRYIPLPRDVQVLAGNLDIVAGIAIDRSGARPRTSITGTAELANGRLTVPRISEPVSNISGRVVLLDQRAFLSLRGNAAGSNVDLTGTVSNFRNPTLNLALRAPNLDYGRAVRSVEFLGGLVELDPRGVGPLRARITGTLRQPVVDINANIPQLTIQGYTARNVSVSGTYRPGRFDIGRTRFRLFGGEFAASGTVNLAGVPSLTVTGRVTGANLSELPLPGGVQATGEVTGDFNITGPIANPVVTVSASIPGGTVNDVPFGSADGRFVYQEGQVRISRLEVRQIEGGTVRVAGDVSLEQLDLAVEARGVQVERFAEILGQPGLRGIAFFEGRIRGRPAAPIVTGDLEVFQARVRDVGIDYARITLTGEERVVRVTDAVIRILPGEIRFSGTLNFLRDGRIAFDGQASILRMTVDKLASILGLEDVPASGVIEGVLQASGIYVPGAETPGEALVDTVASGSIRVNDATAFGYPVQTATAELSYRDNVLTIDRALVTSQDAELTLAGNANLETGLVDMRFGLSDFQLSRLGDFLGTYGDVRGTLAATGTLSGPLDDVRIAVQADIADLAVNNQQYGQAQLTAAYEDGLVDSLVLTLTRDELQRLVVTVDDYDPETNCVASAQAVINDASIPLLWSIMENSPYLRTEDGEGLLQRIRELPAVTAGTIDGTVSLTGCLDELNGAAELTVTNLTLDEHSIESVVVDASIAQGIVTLNQLTAVSDETTLVAGGTLALEDGQINLDVNAQNFDLNNLRPWLGENTPSGTLAAEFVVQGAITSPFIKGSVEVVNPAFGGVEFERFRISTIEVRENQIEISDAILASGRYQIVGQGTLPWDWSTVSIPADQPISFTASMEEQDLSVLASFAPIIDEERTSGPINANLVIGGTLVNPDLSGEITLANGNLAIDNMETQLTDINVNLEFMGNRIVFNQLSTSSSLGGNARVLPGGVIDFTGPGVGQIDLRVSVDDFVIAEQNLLGFQENIRTQVDAGLSVTGDLSSPLIADAVIPGLPAGITLSNGNFIFAIPEGFERQERLVLGINPRFDVSLSVGPNVTISPPDITLSVVSRQGSLRGSLTDPVLDLTLEIVEGNIRLAGRRLRVVPGGLIYAQFSPPGEPEVRFDFDAITNVFATSPLGGRERYEIILHIGGRLDDLQISLESSPPGLSQEQMLAALGHVEGIFTSGEAQLQEELVNILGAIGTQTIFAPIETLFIDRFGFEVFTLELQPGLPIALYASTNLFGNYYLSVFWRLTSDFAAVDATEWEFTFSYRFRRIYNFYISIDDQQVTTIGAGYTNSISL